MGRPKWSNNRPKATAAPKSLFTVPTVKDKEEPVTVTVKEEPAVVDEIKQEKQELNLDTIKYRFTCEICEKVYPGSPILLDFVRVTGKADYYREARSAKLHACNNCCNELSDYVDKWLLKKNPKLKKYDIGSTDQDGPA